MPRMRGLTIIVISADASLFNAALSIATAHAANGALARIYLHADAVALAAPPYACPEDARHAAAGLPALAQLMEEARALGVEIIVCQTGLALTGLSAEALAPGMEVGGLVSLMSTLGNDRLVTL